MMLEKHMNAVHMEALMREYYDGCNEANREKIMRCFTPDAIHYFPPGMYEGPFRSSEKIAERWHQAVEKFGSYWTIDALLIDSQKGEAVIEWTHFKTEQGTVLRGAEWVVFDRDSGLMLEIRAYYASPQATDLKRLELGGFDYEQRGYELDSPRGRSGRQ